MPFPVDCDRISQITGKERQGGTNETAIKPPGKAASGLAEFSHVF
jgi:hypothetical protein